MDKKESFGAEVAKQLPIKDIYNDVAHPALSTVGEGLQGIVKMALAPVSAMVWGYDQIANYLAEAIPEYFINRKIEKEKIKSPDPAIAVPLIEAMRYTSHKEEIREMFVNLLGEAMNSDTEDEHPSFVEIIKQLTPDECKMLKYLYKNPKLAIIKLRIAFENDKGESDAAPYFSDICFLTSCQYPEKFPEYLDNLQRLGLVNVIWDRHLADDIYYEKLKEHPSYPCIAVSKGQKIIEYKNMFELSEYGKKFCKVCISE